MIEIPDRPNTTAEQARSILMRHNANRGIYIDLDRVIDYRTGFMEKSRPHIKDMRKLSGSRHLWPTENNDILDILTTKFAVPIDHFITTYKNDKGELEQKVQFTKDIVTDIVDNKKVNEGALEFLQEYQKANEYVYLYNYFKQYESLPILSIESYNNHRMVLARPEWHIQATGRLGARQPSVLNIKRTCNDIVTCPKGYQLVFADSGQIEPRIKYSVYVPDLLIKDLIILYNDAYYGMLHYVVMSPEERDACRRGKVLIPMDKDKDVRDSLKHTALAAGYGSKLGHSEDELINGFIREIQNHTMQRQWEARVRREVNMGATSFEAFFGTKIYPSETAKYKKGTKSWIDHLVRCGLNNPIQTTAGELMRESVAEADKIIMQECKYDTFINFYKHDEGCFTVDDRDAIYIPKLGGCTAYNVRDWIPIESEIHIGQKKGDPEITIV